MKQEFGDRLGLAGFLLGGQKGIGQTGHCRVLEDRPQRQFGCQGAAQPCDHLRGEQRVAPEVEEAVVDADPSSRSTSCQVG